MECGPVALQGLLGKSSTEGGVGEYLVHFFAEFIRLVGQQACFPVNQVGVAQRRVPVGHDRRARRHSRYDARPIANRDVNGRDHPVAPPHQPVQVFDESQIFHLRPYVKPCWDGMWARKVLVSGLSMMPPNLVGNIQIYLERFLITRYGGIGPLGIYEHAKRYRHLLGVGVGAFSRSQWPASLEEAGEKELSFAGTRRVWDGLYVLTALAGLSFVCLGDRLISVLTHGKFVESYPLAIVWIIYLQMTGMQRPQVAVMYAKGLGAKYSSFHLASIGLSIALMLFFIPRIGPLAGVVSFVAQEAMFRGSLYVYCKVKFGVPWFDQWAWVGVLFVSAGYLLTKLTGPAIEARFFLLAILSLTLIFNGRRPLAPVFQTIPWVRRLDYRAV